VAHLIKKFKVSERRACQLVGQHRSTNRYAPVAPDFEAKLVARMTKLAERHPRWGYRMVHGLLLEEGWPVNKKRIERLWRQEGLQVPPSRLKSSGQKAIGEQANSAWLLPALYPNHVWSYDFMSARTSDGGSLRILNVVDEHTRESLGSHVARSIGANHVSRHLAKLFAQHGKPKFMRADNGREFIADIGQQWLLDQGVQPVFIEKASPQQNCYIERFNGSMRREVLNPESFHSVLEAKVVIEDWNELYNTRRVHRGLAGLTPAAYGKMARARVNDDRCEGGS
jgi:transposase InsO family protein